MSESTPAEVIYVDPRTLKNNTLNINIYGDEFDSEFVESVRSLGVKTPLLLASDGETIVSGHRRRSAAITCGIRLVPVIVDKSLDNELDVSETLILLNRQRPRTAEQKAREYTALKRIAEERLKREGTKPADAPPPEAKVSPAAASAARAIGSSVTTMERAAKVVKVIDDLTEEGETEKAEELREVLNTSVKAAVEKVAPKKKKPSGSGMTPQVEARQILQRADELTRDISRAFQKASAVVPCDEECKRAVDCLDLLKHSIHVWISNV